MTSLGRAGDGWLAPSLALATPSPLDEQTTALALARQRFCLLDRAALDDMPPPASLVDGLLPREGLAMLAGSRGLGKTFLAMSLAGAVSTPDLPTWMGMGIAVHGPALFVALEGFAGIPARLRAWESWQQRQATGIAWTRSPMDLKHTPDAHQLGLIAADLGAVAVFIDSARASGAGAEDTRDMGAFVHGLERVQRTFGGLVVVVHNTGWDGTRERGSTLLPDSCDVTLLLDGNPTGVRKLEHRKHRDGEPMSPLHLTFRAIPGSGSGVLVPAEHAEHAATLRELLLAAIRDDPGHSTGHYADRIGKHRPHVSQHASALLDERRIENRGNRNNPNWHPAEPNQALDLG